MKTSLLRKGAAAICMFFCILTVSNAATKIAITNGNWSNPAIWSPAGAPTGINDTVIIQANVVLDMYAEFQASWFWVKSGYSLTGDSTLGVHGNVRNDGLIDLGVFATGDGDSTLNFGILAGVKYAGSNTLGRNLGTVTCDTFLVSENTFYNQGTMQVIMLTTAGIFHNYATVEATLYTQDQSGYNHTGAGIRITQTFVPNIFQNMTGAIIDAGDITTSNLLTNDGDISCTNLTHGNGTITGNGGKFCIAQCFINNASISGNIDICDASPGGFCDLNMGTIAPSVTTCTVGPCAHVGIDENSFFEVELFPNPASSNIQLNGDMVFTVVCYAANGQAVYSSSQEKTSHFIDVQSYPAGLYFIRCLDAHGNTLRQLTWVKE